MIKAVIFDCFGVLVGRGFWTIYQELGGDVERDQDFIDAWLNMANSGTVSSDEFSRVMAERLNTSIEKYSSAFKEDERPNSAIFELIQTELVGKYKLALVSNATGESVRNKIPPEKLQLFDEVFISAEVGLLKPDPTLFELVLNKLQVAAEETVFIDDHQQYIDGAERAGLNTALFTDVADLRTRLIKFDVISRKGE